MAISGKLCRPAPELPWLHENFFKLEPTDQSWTLIEAQGEWQHAPFCDIEIIGGKLYAATKDASESLTVIQLQDANDGGPSTYTTERTEYKIVEDPTIPWYVIFAEQFLVELNIIKALILPVVSNLLATGLEFNIKALNN
ncbi:hypothetical protein FF1_029319 [Malus domestica]